MFSACRTLPERDDDDIGLESLPQQIWDDDERSELRPVLPRRELITSEAPKVGSGVPLEAALHATRLPRTPKSKESTSSRHRSKESTSSLASSQARAPAQANNIINDYGDTRLHLAAFRGDLEDVKQLVANGANMDARNITGNTPLHEAALRNREKVLGALIKAGANTKIVNGAGYTVYGLAEENGCNAMVSLLLAHDRSLTNLVSEW